MVPAGFLSFLKTMTEGAAFEMIKEAVHYANEKLSEHKNYYNAIESPVKYLTSESQCDEGETYELTKVFTEEHMRLLAEKLKNCSGYDIRESLSSCVEELMNQSEMPYELKSAYAEWICGSVIAQLQVIDSEKYDRVYLADLRKGQELRENAIIQKLDAMQRELNILSNNKIEIDSADIVDCKLKKMTINPSIGIEFFATDDDDFKTAFSSKRNEERVFVQGRSREETIYCVINELRILEDTRPIYVVKTEEAWKWLEKREPQGNVYIPWFYSEEINVLAGNTNIFAYSDDMVNPSGGTIKLRPRTRRFLTECLKKSGMDYEKAAQLVESTHGLYIPLKQRIYNSAFYKTPRWVKELPLRVQRTCLLIGQWTDLEGDKESIELLSGMNYESFIDLLRPFMISEDPLIYHVRLHGSNYYSLAVPEEAWDNIPVSVNDEIWKDFYRMLESIIMNAEKVFTYSGEEKLFAQVRGEAAHWSGYIREGMLRTLIMKALYKQDVDIQVKLDRFVEQILQNTKKVGQWKYILKYFSQLCEISPRSVLDKMKVALEDSSGELYTILKEQPKLFEWGENYSFQIISGLEALLCQRRYAVDAFCRIVHIAAIRADYQQNLAESVIEKVLCPLANSTAICTPEGKGRAAESALMLNPKCFNMLYEAMTRNHYLFSPPARPKYREFVDVEAASPEAIHETYVRYGDILLKHMDFLPERWELLFQNTGSLGNDFLKKAIIQLKYEITQMDDPEILRVKRSVLGSIFREKYTAKELNGNDDARFCLIENILVECHTAQPEYEYALFFVTNESPLLFPANVHEERSWEINEEKTRELLQKKIECFQNNGLDLRLLSSICAEYPENRLGRYLGLFWNGGIFDLSVFRILASQEKTETIAIEYYLNSSVRRNVCFKLIIKSAIELGCSEKSIVGLYLGQMYDAEELPEIDKADENIKKLFWTKRYLPFHQNTKWMLDQCRQYGTLDAYLALLLEINRRKHFKPEELLFHLSALLNIRIGDENNSVSYYLRELLVPVQTAYMLDEEKRRIILRIEIAMSPFLEGADFRCLKTEMINDPKLYAELVSVLYKKDSTKSEKTNDKKINQNIIFNLRNLYSKIQFCPGEEEGIVKEEKLQEWINKFIFLLEQNDQKSLQGMLLGRLFAFSPAGTDGYKPCEAVRTMIEKYADSSLLSEYGCTVINGRGVIYIAEGKTNKTAARKYREVADCFSCTYPKTAEIYYALADEYDGMAKEERIEAEAGLH